jgi:hypothetical protein
VAPTWIRAADRRAGKRAIVPNVNAKAGPKGRPEGSPFFGNVVVDHAVHALRTATAQGNAIAWARAQWHHPLVARVRHLNNKKSPDNRRRAD